jgi:hypothetical protein
MEDIIELGGGPYIVKKNEGGGFEFRYGWAEINIVNGNTIKVICTDDEDVTRTILKFNIINTIPREYKILEKIQIYLKLGFNSIYAYNYSDINKFKIACEKYFRELDNQLTI